MTTIEFHLCRHKFLRQEREEKEMVLVTFSDLFYHLHDQLDFWSLLTTTTCRNRGKNTAMVTTTTKNLQ